MVLVVTAGWEVAVPEKIARSEAPGAVPPPQLPLALKFVSVLFHEMSAEKAGVASKAKNAKAARAAMTRDGWEVLVFMVCFEVGVLLAE